MKFREPLDITCPNCEHQFECSLAWIRREGQECPKCHASLAAVRAPIEGMISEFTHLVEDVERILAVEREFKIEITDTEAETLATFADAHNFLMRRLAIDYQNSVQAEQTWNRLCEVVRANANCRVAESPTAATPFIRTKPEKVAT